MKLKFFIIILFLISSCNQEKKANDLITEIFVHQKIDFGELISDIEFVPIIENDGYYMEQVAQVIGRNDRLYFRSMRQPAIFIFDNEGRFINKIEATGPGPEEFSNVFQMSLSKSDSTLLVVDSDKNKICEVNEYTNEVIRCFAFKDMNVNSVYYHNDAIYTLTNGHSTGFLKVFRYSDFSLIHESIYAPHYINSMPSIRPFSDEGDDIFVLASMADTVYKVSNYKDVEPYFILNPNLPSLSSIEENVANLFFTQELKAKYPDYTISPGLISSYKSFLFIPDMNRRIQVIVHPKTRNMLELDLNNEIYSNLISRGYFFTMYFVKRGYATSVIYLSENFYIAVNKYISEFDNQTSKALKDFIEKYPSTSEFTNPVVVKFALNMEYLESLFQN